MPKFSAIDLFSGSGGLTLGLKKAGFNVLGAIEIDPLAAETYKKNHPETRLWEQDIRTVDPTGIKAELGLDEKPLDLLAGCPPCQGFSSMTTLKGKRTVNDPRNDLIFEFLRFVTALSPRAVMMENVPGLADDRRLKKLIKGLENLGYRSKCLVLNSADFMVPQRRKRLILLAGKDGDIDIPSPAKAQRTVRDAIADLPKTGESGDPLHDLPEHRSERVIKLIRRIPKNGGSRMALGIRAQLKCHKRFRGFRDVYGRMSWDKVAPTITGGCVNPSKGRFVHPMENRAITLREAALLQTFPRNYYFSLKGGKHNAALLIGNALPPEFIKRIAFKIREFITSNG